MKLVDSWLLLEALKEGKTVQVRAIVPRIGEWHDADDKELFRWLSHNNSIDSRRRNERREANLLGGDCE